jgi:hypothetical protein
VATSAARTSAVAASATRARRRHGSRRRHDAVGLGQRVGGRRWRRPGAATRNGAAVARSFDHGPSSCAGGLALVGPPFSSRTGTPGGRSGDPWRARPASRRGR